MLWPEDGLVVQGGTVFRLKAQATDNDQIVEVKFTVDGMEVDTITEAPYETSYMLPDDVGAGRDFVIEAVARDAMNNTGT